MLDELFRNGLTGASDGFVDFQARFVAGCQQADGGFSGRQGGSDLYYTDFALRCLALLAPGHAALERAKSYIERQTRTPRSIVEIFSLLNAHRMLRRRLIHDVRGVAPKEMLKDAQGIDRIDRAIDLPILKDQLHNYILPKGGFARFDGDRRVSAYHTFLGDLCFQMLGEDLPAVDDAVRAIEALKRPDGGYAELDGQAASQTGATAAAVAFLMMHDAVSPDQTADTIGFLANMQSADGGLKPHDAVENGDLLSTFTGLVTMAALDGLNCFDAARIAGFLRTTAHPGGGFIACAGDDSPDVEYTYYGLGALAILHPLK
jgi:geranylgeranyl transferase type-2 subunit beta